MRGHDRLAVPGQLCFPPLIHPFKTGAVGDQGVSALRASIRGRVAYHNCCLKHDDIIDKEKTRRKVEGLPTDCPDLEAKADTAKKDVLNSRKVRKPLKRNEATVLRGMMGSDNYGLFKKTLELKEDTQTDNTPPALSAAQRRARDNAAKHVKPKVDSLAQVRVRAGCRGRDSPRTQQGMPHLNQPCQPDCVVAPSGSWCTAPPRSKCRQGC